MSKSGRLYMIYLLVLLLSVLFFVRYDFGSKNAMVPAERIATAYNGLEYAGSQTCVSCHEDIYYAHLETPHYRSSQLIHKAELNGDFTINNTVKLNDHIVFKMIVFTLIVL